MSKVTRSFDIGISTENEDDTENDTENGDEGGNENESERQSESQPSGYQLSDNIAKDVIHYSRGNIITNEPQSYLTLLGWLTGNMANEKEFINSVVIGTSSGGKSHLMNHMKQLLPDNTYYQATSGSDKSFIDDDSWNEKRVAILSELQKLGPEILEFMKSVAGGDGGYEYARSVPDSGDGAESGDRKTKKIFKEAKPFTFSYAQFAMDAEMWNRLLKIYISEGRKVNRSVARMHGGHGNIMYSTDDGADWNYIYPTEDVKLKLKRHHRNMPTDAHTFVPEWCFYAYEPILDLKRSESKRSSAMIPNLIRASALQNYHNRQTIENSDDDGRSVECIVVKPQDVANVLSCRKVLLGTTHELELRKLSIVDAVRANTKMNDWCSLNDIQSWLDVNAIDVSRLKKEQLRELLRELAENFVIEISERHFEGNAHGYQFLSLSDLGSPKLTGFNESVIDYESENPLLGVDDVDDPFKDCVDPITGLDFKESVEQFQGRLRNSVVESASSAMSSGSSNGGREGGNSSSKKPQRTLGGEPESTYTITDPVEERVLDLLHTYADGRQFGADVDHEVILGLVSDDENISEADMSGTLLDPSTEVWAYDDGSKRVNTQSEARREVEKAFGSLMGEGIVFLETDGGGEYGTVVVDDSGVEYSDGGDSE